MAKIAEHLINAEVGHDPQPRCDGHDSERIWDSENQRYVEAYRKVFADALGIKNGDKVKVSSRRGQIETIARVGKKVSQGETWMPFHFPDGNANWLTNAALDKYARIPEYKVCAIKIEKAE